MKIVQDGPNFENLVPKRMGFRRLDGIRREATAEAVTAATLIREQFPDHPDFPKMPIEVDMATAVAAACLQPTDWLVAGPKELAAALCRGVSYERVLATFTGASADPQLGRVPPGFVPDRVKRVVPAYSSVGAFSTHAAGIGWAARLSGSKEIVLSFLHGGRMSEADVHTGLNFAGVFDANAVFVALAPQGQRLSLARTAHAYGLRCERADLSDLAAVSDAIDFLALKARSGEGAGFVEITLTPGVPTILSILIDQRRSIVKSRIAQALAAG